jgi:glycosyltransferase involved in cell wall biosynthesis
MKVVQVCPRFYPWYGGIETHVREISKRLIRLGLDVRILTTDPTNKLPKEELIDGIAISRFHSFTFNEVHFFAPRLYSALMDLKDADLIHIHDYQDLPDLVLALTYGCNRKPFVLTPHFHPMGGSTWRTIAKKAYNLSLGKRIMQKADVVIAVSEYEKQLLQRKFGLQNYKVKYIPNGVDIKKIENIERKNVENKVILYVGRLEKYKGVQFLLKSFYKIKEDIPTSQLLIVGVGPYKNNLVRIANRLKIIGDVKFLENVPEKELMKLYCASSLFVMPSRYEAFCIALIEAMACGLPVIATKVGGMKELIKPNETGFLIDYPPNENLLAELIISLLEDPDTSRRIGEKAREYVLNKFSWSVVVQHLFTLYRNILKED